jgi:Fe-S-cluster containining protein
MIFESSRELVASALRPVGTSARALTAIRQVDQVLDENIQANLFGKPAQACVPGCNHCCHLVVHATIAEVAQAADFISRLFTQEQKADLAKRLYEYERVVGPWFGRNLGKVRTPCPLLEAGLCSIYEARPLRCRGVNSLDASVCEQQKLHPELDIAPPRTEGQMELARDAIRGTIEGLAQASPNIGMLDFARALSIALSQPTALDEHFSGENPFNPAKALPGISGRPKLADNPPFYANYGPGDEPVGRCSPSDLLPHYEFYIKGDTTRAIETLTGRHPVNLIRKITVPLLYRSEDEVQFWRKHVERAIDELGQAEFDPREAYDALEALSTLEIAYQQGDDKAMVSKLGQIICNRITGRAVPDLCEPLEPQKHSGRIKVGYITENLTFNNGGSWALGWLRNHGEDIETTAICLSDKTDTRTAQFRNAAHQFLLFPDGNPKNARAIKDLGLDVLIYPDMSGRNVQYASMRLAPVQCVAWGHPVTCGIPTIDYYLSSDLMEPANAQDHYSEKLVRLPGSALCYSRDKTPSSRLTKADFELDEGPLYLSCQNPMKYLPRWDSLYRKVNDATGRPIVFVEGIIPMDKAGLKDRMATAGINAVWIPALGSSDFLSLIQLADVCLDSPGWNGGNTTIQALSEGVPVVTLPGEFMRGRHSLAFCQIANVPDLVAASPEEYVALAGSRDRLKAAMAGLQTDALFEDTRPVQALDEFFRSIFA